MDVLIAPFRRGNPYQRLLAEAIRVEGVNSRVGKLSVGKRALSLSVDADMLHLHWLHPIYKAYIGGKLESQIKVSLFKHLLSKHKNNGGGIVWTVHNLWPHEQPYPQVDRRCRQLVHRMADALIFHSENARSEYVETFGARSEMYIIPHGRYPVSLVPQPGQEEARHYYGLRSDVILGLFLGQAREYKGYERLVKVVPDLKDHDIHMVFAGDREYGLDVRIGDADNVTVFPYEIPEYELPVLFSACDVLLLPYRHCTTSGMAVLGTGFGTPLVCTAVGQLENYCEAGLGMVAEPEHTVRFALAVQRAAEIAESSRYRRARREFLDPREWSAVARQTVALYRDILATR